jgi:hypothetical protein
MSEEHDDGIPRIHAIADLIHLDRHRRLGLLGKENWVTRKQFLKMLLGSTSLLIAPGILVSGCGEDSVTGPQPSPCSTHQFCACDADSDCACESYTGCSCDSQGSTCTAYTTCACESDCSCDAQCTCETFCACDSQCACESDCSCDAQCACQSDCLCHGQCLCEVQCGCQLYRI